MLNVEKRSAEAPDVVGAGFKEEEKNAGKGAQDPRVSTLRWRPGRSAPPGFASSNILATSLATHTRTQAGHSRLSQDLSRTRGLV